MTNILVIGCASRDRLHIAGQVYETTGGAGLYTALAAAHSGGAVTLLGPRPDPLPDAFSPVANRVQWIGPLVSPAEIPRLEIAHRDNGQATLLDAAWGAESILTPVCLEPDLSRYAIVHIAALSSARKQLEFLHACRARGARKISVGTYARIVHGETETVRQLSIHADLFFMNENEAHGLFGLDLSGLRDLSSLYFVTLGDHGAYVFADGAQMSVAGVAAEVVDPTGAGDAFCGVVLVELARSGDPVAAATAGVRLASQSVERVGPEAVANPPSVAEQDNL